jgi:translation initiation factor IF-1
VRTGYVKGKSSAHRTRVREEQCAQDTCKGRAVRTGHVEGKSSAHRTRVREEQCAQAFDVKPSRVEVTW